MDEHMVIPMDTESQAFKHWKGIGLPSTFVIEAYGPVNWDAPYVITMLMKLMKPSAMEAVSANKQ